LNRVGEASDGGPVTGDRRQVDASRFGDMLTQKALAHLPLLLHPDPKEVCIIGLALTPNGNGRLLVEEPLSITQLVGHGGDRFAHLVVVHRLKRMLRRPGARICNGVFEGKVNPERFSVNTANSFDDVQLLAVWVTDSIEPRRILEAH